MESRGADRSSRSPALPPHRRRKLAGRSALVVLLVLAVITGSLAGLTLVYSTDLPQINELEHYRPSTITDLYDRYGQQIGSFALERREDQVGTLEDAYGLAPAKGPLLNEASEPTHSLV